MSIEETLAANTAALEENTAALKGFVAAVKSASVAPAGAKKEPEKKKGPTVDDVRAKLKGYGAIEGKEAAIKIIKDFGADSVSELDPAKFQAVIDKVDELEKA